ncbi:MAG TPA: antibiotic biosynthesis monooxygenase [Gammaproteobacteria bacterium]
MTRAYTYIWAFEVHPEHVVAFRWHYGAGGAWTQLFRRARGYLGTQLLEDQTDSVRFVTIDTWSSVEDYEAFRTAYASEYAELDRLCEGFTVRETLIGHFTSEPHADP